MDGLYEMSRLNNLNINVTTVFPPLVNTRKSFIDQFVQADGRYKRESFYILFCKCVELNIFAFSLNAASDLVLYTAEDVGVATVDAVLKNKQYVSLPFFLRKIAIFTQ